MKNLQIQVINFLTPQRLELSGLQLGPAKPKRVYIFIHGLGGGLFSRFDLISLLPDKNSAVLIFNNRGYGIINGFKRFQGGKHERAALGGMAHEVFTDCVDDISGAVAFAKNLGTKEIILIGHSTGCQKSVFYLAKKPNSPVKGAVLLAPVSDYAALKKDVDVASYKKALRAAQKLFKSGQPHSLLPANLWRVPIDAQRFISLYTPDSQEEIFTYASDKKPTTLRKANRPLLAVLAEADEYHDRPTSSIAAWFEKSLAGKESDTVVISGVGHNFYPGFEEVCRLIKRWSDRTVKKK